tara:strand:+ start:202 stop:918 length:717 start_codon:yes stop_codon:yes gene_type:complete
MKNLSIIVPIYKEKNNIAKLTSKIRKSLNFKNYEIIFVDDNSNDGTKKILINLKKKFKNFKFIIRKKKKDLTQSCFDGIEKSKYSKILIMDGDLQHNPKYIPKLMKIYDSKNADVVIATRDLFYGKNPGLNYFRKLFSIVLISLFSILIGKKTKDPMSGYFLFNKKIFNKNKKKYFGKGYKILADILYNSSGSLKIIDYDIEFGHRLKNKSKMNFKILIILLEFLLTTFIKKILKNNV